MIIDFFINGSGIQSEINYNKCKFIWIGVFIFFGLLQLFFVNKYFKISWLKYICIILAACIYSYIGFRYF